MENPDVSHVDGIILKSGFRKLRVLFVNNNHFNNSYNTHHDIEFSYATVVESLNKIKEKETPTDAVIVEPGLDFSEIETIRRSTDQSNLPLILYSSSFEPKIKDMAMKLGVDDYFYGSMSYTIASRIKFIKRLRDFKIRWLKYENEHRNEQDAVPGMLQLFHRRIVDIVASSILLILFSPVILGVMIALEIETINDRVFSNSKRRSLMFRIINTYEFIVLMLFLPLILIITIPFKIDSREEHLFSKFKKVGQGYKVFELYKFRTELIGPCATNKKRSSYLGQFLTRSRLAELPQLINVLKGDITFVGRRPLDVSEAVSLTSDQHAKKFLRPPGIVE